MKKNDNKSEIRNSLYRILLLVIFGLILLGQFGRVQILNGLGFYLFELAIAWVLFVWLVDKRKTRINKKLTGVYQSGVFFLGVAVLSLVFNMGAINIGVIKAGLYLVRLVLYGSLWPMLVDMRKRKIIKFKITNALIAMGVILGLEGLVQYFFKPDTTNLVLYGWDDHLYRAVGSLLDPNFLGLIIVLTLILLNFKKKPDWRLVGLMLVALGLTYSRSAYLALGVSTGVIVLYKRSVRLLIGFVVTIVIGIGLLPNRGGAGNNLWRTFSLNQRIYGQQEAIDVWKSKPIFGVGFNAYSEYLSNNTKYEYLPLRVSGPDNSFLLILATTGMIGMLAFINFGRELFKIFGKQKWIVVSLIAIGSHSLLNNSLFYPFVMIWFFGLLAEASVTESI